MLKPNGSHRDAATRCRVIRAAAAGAGPSLGLQVIGDRTDLVEEN